MPARRLEQVGRGCVGVETIAAKKECSALLAQPAALDLECAVCRVWWRCRVSTAVVAVNAAGGD